MQTKTEWMPIKEAAILLGFEPRGYFCHTKDRDKVLARLGIRSKQIGRLYKVYREDVERCLKPDGPRKRSVGRKSSGKSLGGADVVKIEKL